jgi:hypothetical protein
MRLQNATPATVTLTRRRTAQLDDRRRAVVRGARVDGSCAGARQRLVCRNAVDGEADTSRLVVHHHLHAVAGMHLRTTVNGRRALRAYRRAPVSHTRLRAVMTSPAATHLIERAVVRSQDGKRARVVLVARHRHRGHTEAAAQSRSDARGATNVSGCVGEWVSEWVGG